MKFWDTSALVPLFVEEPRSGSVKPIFGSDTSVVVWWANPVECCSTFSRLVRERVITATEEEGLRNEIDVLADCWSEIDPSSEIRTIARRLLRRHPLRAADSMHLAAALIWADNRPEGFEFVCIDKRLRDAAGLEGFTVLPSQYMFDSFVL
jgi:predicted nucleic acid-binding protein